MKYSFTVIKKDWYKRRRPDENKAIPINVSIEDFALQANHMCHMNVEYDDGSQKTLLARVLQNQITKEWKVDGMEVAVKVEIKYE